MSLVRERELRARNLEILGWEGFKPRLFDVLQAASLQP